MSPGGRGMWTSMDEGSRTQVSALEEERAFLDRSPWRKVRVTGADAVTWLATFLAGAVRGARNDECCR